MLYRCESQNQLKASNQEVHRLRKQNAKLRDDYQRAVKRLQGVEAILEEHRRDKRAAEITKQKDYEYIIKQDKQIESYQANFSKINSKVSGKSPFSLTP